MISTADINMRILMISPQFRPLIGGYERAAERLSMALAEAGMRILVLAERRHRDWPAVEWIDGYEVRRLWCVYRRRVHIITFLFALMAYLFRYGREYDVWHVHNYGSHAALAVLIGKLLHRPVLLKLTSSTSMGIEKSLGRGLHGYILRYFHRRVSACVAVSDETRDEAIRFGIPEQHVRLIPNGADGRQFYPVSADCRRVARRALGLNCQQLVLYVGRLSAEKNPLGLLDAWSAVSEKAREGALLAVVGDGPEYEKVRAKAQMPSLSGSVHVAGRRSDVATWLSAADIYVIPSHNEGLSNTMIEALASGLPVISTRVSGSSILVKSPSAGLVVDIRNVGQLAFAIGRLLEDASMRTRLGENARLKFESNFSLESLSRKMILLYEDLLDRRNEQK